MKCRPLSWRLPGLTRKMSAPAPKGRKLRDLSTEIDYLDPFSSTGMQAIPEQAAAGPRKHSSTDDDKSKTGTARVTQLEEIQLPGGTSKDFHQNKRSPHSAA